VSIRIQDGLPDAGTDSVDAGDENVVSTVLRRIVCASMAWKYKKQMMKKEELSPNSIAGKEDAPP
jgi:hypothetical protein